MDHLYISTVIDPGHRLHFGGKVESRLELQSVEDRLAAQRPAQCLTSETGGTQVLGSRYLRPRQWGMEGYANLFRRVCRSGVAIIETALKYAS
jgi:hypothetical protein